MLSTPKTTTSQPTCKNNFTLDLIKKLFAEQLYEARVHGNGFIQIDLNAEQRMHVWGHPDIPRQKTYTPLHDHRFAFRSWILKGRLQNEVFSYFPVYSGNFQRWVVGPDSNNNTILKPTGEHGDMRLLKYDIHQQYNYYDMDVGDIHISTALEPTISVIYKHGPTLNEGGPAPSVFVPKDQEADNSFRRDQFPPELLWRIITDVLYD
jgi:hypothetical protein